MPSDKEQFGIIVLFLCAIVSLFVLIHGLSTEHAWEIAIAAFVIGWIGHVLYTLWHGWWYGI